MINKIKLKVFGVFVYLLGGVLKKNDNLWIVGAGNGQAYVDNSRYLFEWIVTEKDKQVYWITKNKSVYHSLNQNKESKVAYFYSLKGLMLVAKAKVYICSHGINDVTPYVNKSKILVCLWHGLPIKKIGGMTQSSFGKDNNINKVFIKLLNAKTRYDLFLTPSQFYKDIFEKSFNHQIADYLFAQYPRVTELKNQSELPSERKFKTILFAPTFRDFVESSYYETTGILPSVDFLKVMNHILGNEKYQIIIKLHPYINLDNNYIKVLEGYDNIIFADKNKDVLDLLKLSDILITDYSSIYFDFISLNREVIFLMPDYEWYANNGRGLNFEFIALAPGVTFTSWVEVVEYLQQKNELFVADDKYMFSLKISNEFGSRTNEYIYNAIEKRVNNKWINNQE